MFILFYEWIDEINLNNDGMAVILYKYYKIKKNVLCTWKYKIKKGGFIGVHITFMFDGDDVDGISGFARQGPLVWFSPSWLRERSTEKNKILQTCRPRGDGTRK